MKEVSGCGENGCGGRRPLARPETTYRPTVVKRVHVNVPAVSVSVEKTYEADGSFVACPNCGGASRPKPVESRPTVVVTKKENICPNGQVSRKTSTFLLNHHLIAMLYLCTLVFDQVCCRSRSSAQPLPQGSCGVRQACGADRKTGASNKQGDSEFGEYPWQVINDEFDKWELSFDTMYQRQQLLDLLDAVNPFPAISSCG